MKGESPSVIRNFSPAWFATVMGTGVIPLSMAFLKAPWAKGLGVVFVWLSVILFIVILIPWTLKFIRYPEAAREDLNHPIAGNFYPTMPIAMIVLALDFLKYRGVVLPLPLAVGLAKALWILGSAGIYLFGFVISLRMYTHSEIDLPHANFGWYIPPVSKLIIPVAGFELAALSQNWQPYFLVSLVSLGVGFFLFLFVGAAVYHRYIYHEMPMARLAPTFFIGIAPTAIIAIVVAKMMHFFHHVQTGFNPSTCAVLCKISLLVFWGLSIWWFVMSLLVILYYIRSVGMSYALSWWAFTFPSGALAVSTGVTFRVFSFPFLYWSFWLLNAFLIGIWTVVAVLTLRAVSTGAAFRGH